MSHGNDNDTWPTKAAVVITHANQNIGMMLKELLRNFHWTVVQTTPSVQLALEYLHQGSASMLIVDDSPEGPAPVILRQLLYDPMASMTPTLSFVGVTNRTERAAITNLGRPLIVDKPLTPNRFIPGFRTLVKVWSSGYYLIVRHAISAIVAGNESSAMKILTKLAENAKARVLIAPAIAHYFRKNGNIVPAEKVVLSALKTMPRNLGLILALADHYFHAAAPHTAARLLTGADATYGNTIATFADRYQAHMLMQNFDGVIKTFRELQEKKYFPAEYQSYMARVLYSEGRMLEFEKIISSSTKAEKLISAWNNSGEKTHEDEPILDNQSNDLAQKAS